MSQESISINLDKPTIWKITVRDIGLFIGVTFLAGATYAGIRIEISAIRQENELKRSEIATLTTQIASLGETINKLANQVNKLEGRLEGRLDR